MVLTTKIKHKIISPLRDLLNDSRATGVLLLAVLPFQLYWLISVLAGTGICGMEKFNHWPYTSALNCHRHWINNFLMAFFFLLAGMEIKRELVTGELSSFKKAILPFGAAFGGMLVPALIFTIFNFRTPQAHGWGIPTATDIAFSIGIASLLGKRFPVGLKILLLAIAIIDDLGAIVVIALFYGGHVQWMYLGIAGLLYASLLAFNYFKVKFGALHVIVGFALWYAMLQSGVEASITGVLFAFAMPVGQLAHVEKIIHRSVNFAILPLFALANTAILLPSNISGALGTSVSMGIICGLVIGKPVGIFLASRLMVGLKIASLPRSIEWKQFLGMGTLAGIGFTMSIFTTMLAFTEAGYRDIAKISILISVIVSVVIGLIYFKAIGVKEVEPLQQPINKAEEHSDLQLNFS